MIKNGIFDYDTKVSFEKRKEEASAVLLKYPDKVPIIVQKGATSKLILPEKFKFKFLAQKTQTIGSFMYELKKRLELTTEQALFVFVNKSIPQMGALMHDIYNIHKDDDGFLKIVFCEENTFG